MLNWRHLFSYHLHMPSCYVHVSTKSYHVGRTLHIKMGQSNCYHLLLSSFVRLNSMFGSIASFSWLRISSPCLINFISQHVSTAVRLHMQSASSKNNKAERKAKQFQYMKKWKETENSKALGSGQPVVNTTDSLMMRWRERFSAMLIVITVHHWIHIL